MNDFQLDRVMEVPRPIEEVFDFFTDPHNLEALTPPWLNFRVLESSDAKLRAGSRIRYGLRLRGIPMSWTSLISRWERPHVFVDEQLKGPYTSWVHTHGFEPSGAGTVVRDHVEYAVLGGTLVNRFLVRPDLERIFDYRIERLRELLTTDPRAGSSTTG
jgi:ligand-binding SRPBCC domain-containing protein